MPHIIRFLAPLVLLLSFLLPTSASLWAQELPTSQAKSTIPIERRFSQTEFDEWNAVRSRIQKRFAEADDWRTSEERSGSVAIQTPTRRIQLKGKRITIYNLSDDDAKALAEVIAHFPELTSVHFAFSSTTKTIPMAVIEGMQHLPALERIVFYFTSGVNWDQRAMRAISQLTTVEDLTLRGVFPDDILKSFTELTNLRKISLSGSYSSRVFDAFAQLPSLNSITLSGGGKIASEEAPPETIKAIASLEGRPMTLRLYRGLFHASIVRELVKLRSTERIAVAANLRDAKIEDFDGIETIANLKGLEVRVLNNVALDAAINKRISVRQRQVAAHSRRQSRIGQIAKQFPNQPPLLESPSVTARQVDEWVRLMAANGRRFDPTELLTYGDVGLNAMLWRVFPEIASKQVLETVGDENVRELLESLDSEKFSEREAATRSLMAKGPAHSDLLEQALRNTTSPEVRTRCRIILKSWQPANTPKEEPTSTSNFVAAWRVYMGRLTNYSSDKLLVEAIIKAMNARVDLTERGKVLGECFSPITKCQDNDLYEQLATLCDHDDVAVPVFVLGRLGGRVGNSYVTPVHKAAIVSKRKELVKKGFTSMPSPVWDQTFLPYLKDYYSKLFSDPTKSQFADDKAFMRLQAFTAARGHKIEAARDYLIQQTDSDDTSHAVRSIYSLCDTAYEQRPLDRKLRQASEKLLASDEAIRRIAGVKVLATYRATDASYEVLLKAIEDRDDEVWRAATNALLQHQAWPKPAKISVNVIARLRGRQKEAENDERMNERLQSVVTLLIRVKSAPRSRVLSDLPSWVERPH